MEEINTENEQIQPKKTKKKKFLIFISVVILLFVINILKKNSFLLFSQTQDYAMYKIYIATLVGDNETLRAYTDVDKYAENMVAETLTKSPKLSYKKDVLLDLAKSIILKGIDSNESISLIENPEVKATIDDSFRHMFVNPNEMNSSSPIIVVKIPLNNSNVEYKIVTVPMNETITYTLNNQNSEHSWKLINKESATLSYTK